jgi:hypothetical protein
MRFPTKQNGVENIHDFWLHFAAVDTKFPLVDIHIVIALGIDSKPFFKKYLVFNETDALDAIGAVVHLDDKYGRLCCDFLGELARRTIYATDFWMLFAESHILLPSVLVETRCDNMNHFIFLA